MIIQEFDKDSPEWLEARQAVITGTRVKSVKPLLRKGKTGSQPMEFWKIVAEYVSYGVEEESPMVRGTHLEAENAEKTIEKYGLTNPIYDRGMIWKDDNGLLGCSPDACENTEEPEWSIECKSLNTAEHLYLIMADKFAKGELPDEFESLFPPRLGEYRGIDSVAEEHQHQVKQSFVVDPKLRVVYYSLYDPRIVLDNLQHYVIEVRRSEMLDDISSQKQMVEEQAYKARAIAKLLTAINAQAK